MLKYQALIELAVRFIKSIIKPVTGLFALLAAKRHGRLEAERAALVEHAKKVKIANDARIAGELDGLQDSDYRD